MIINRRKVFTAKETVMRTRFGYVEIESIQTSRRFFTAIQFNLMLSSALFAVNNLRSCEQAEPTRVSHRL